MSTLVNSVRRVRALEMDQTSWAITASFLSAAAISIVPIACGGAAYYAATKADSKFLRVVAVVSTLLGIVLGVISAI